MPTNTTTYSFQKPVVGADEDSWGGYLNSNWDKVDDLFDGTSAITGIDINSGTIDGTVIGGSSAAAITGTTITGTSFVSSGDMTFGDNNKAIFGAGDLQIYHNGANSFIEDVAGTGSLYIRSNQIVFTNPSGTENVAVFNEDADVRLFHNGSIKLATTSTGIAVTGDATFADNGKAIFGAGSDLQIYHDGSNSYISDQGAGDLLIRSSNDLWLQNASGTETYARFDEGASTYISYAGSTKLTTTATGVDITGVLSSDGLTVDGDAEVQGLRIDAVADVELEFGYANTTHSKIIGDIVTASPTAGQLKFQTSSGGTLYERMRIATNGDISFYEDTGTTAKFFWDASAESLGIGTSSPDSGYKLDVAGNVVFGDGGGFDMNVDGTRWQFSLAGSEKMRIDSSGNVGIGTSSPNSVIDARQESTGGSTQIRVYNTDNSNTTTQTAGLFLSPDSRGNGALIFAEKENADFGTSAGRDISLVFSPVLNNAQIERMRIDSDGNVGIGTSSPDSVGVGHTTLDLKGNSASQVDRSGAIYFTRYDGTKGMYIAHSDGANVFSGLSTYPMVFRTNNTERMRLDSDGNLLVGGSNLPGTDNFPANDTSGYGATILVSSTQKGRFSILGDDECSLNVGRHSGTGNVAQWYYSGSIVGSVSVTASATSYNTSSDYRLKEDVQPMTGACDRVLALKPVNFAWKADGSRVDGFLAHEAQEVVPESVTGTKDAIDADGNPVYQGIDQSKLVPLLTAALQEALTEITDLKARVAALEGN